MYSSIFVNFLIYVHICSAQIVFLFPLAAHTAKCFLMLSYPITPAINTFLDISSIFLHIFIQTGSLNKISCIFHYFSLAYIYAEMLISVCIFISTIDHQTSTDFVEYTRLYAAITEVLFYAVDTRITCYDIFSKRSFKHHAHYYCNVKHSSNNRHESSLFFQL